MVLMQDPALWARIEDVYKRQDEETGIDKAGSANYLVGDIKTGSGIQAWNSCNVRVEKWDGEPLAPDCEWPLRVVEA